MNTRLHTNPYVIYAPYVVKRNLCDLREITLTLSNPCKPCCV
jgi:hypothetical protein